MYGTKDYQVYFLNGIYEGGVLVRTGGRFYLSKGQTALTRRLLLGAEGVAETTKTECIRCGNYVVLTDQRGKNHFMKYARSFTDVHNPCNKEFLIIRAINPWNRCHVLQLPMIIHAKDKDNAIKSFLSIYSDKPYTDLYSLGSSVSMSDYEDRRTAGYVNGSDGTEGYLIIAEGDKGVPEVWIWRSPNSKIAAERALKLGGDFV